MECTMNAIEKTLPLNIYIDRSREIRDIKAMCERAEKGEKIDLNQAAEKLSTILKQFHDGAKAINRKAKINTEVRKAYDLHKIDLDRLNARVQNLLAKTNNMPLWIKPAVYTALTIAGIAALAFIGLNFSTAIPPSPIPPSPIPPSPIPPSRIPPSRIPPSPIPPSPIPPSPIPPSPIPPSPTLSHINSLGNSMSTLAQDFVLNHYVKIITLISVLVAVRWVANKLIDQQLPARDYAMAGAPISSHRDFHLLPPS